jgi:hypothetical protein
MGLLSRVIGPEPTPEERLRKMEIEHAERMKLIETGQPLPEVAIARAKAAQVQASMDAAKANVRAIFSALGPAAVFGVTTGITAIILHEADKSNHLMMMLILWPCAAIVCLGLVAALWFGAVKGVVPQKVLDRLPKPAGRPTPLAMLLGDEATDMDTTDLTHEEIEKLARAIQK